ncbi:septum-promoting GTP-binding protein 1 [Jatropha curcas]|uniref:septum-promoting GTP-binding protein 1 n=1 Tax=Jatropha curcas TaxID=180498 RepID=UPI0018953AA2|nr:septum-promoting GTP-binding protein 1 [Jatropha curcas]
MEKIVVHEKMTQICRKIVHVNIRWSFFERVSVFRQFFQFLWDRILACSIGKPIRYRRLTRRPSSSSSSSPPPEVIEAGRLDSSIDPTTSFSGYSTDSDLVTLKISLLGDCQIGKTSFVIKYVGDEQEKKSLEMTGLNLMDKTLFVQGARITFSIWDVGGDSRSLDHVPIACKDAVAILFMFDLTSRCTLNSVIDWYNEARKWNQTAIPILIGTKFDDFVQLPPNLQWPIVTQARAYAKAMKATLFFSSSKHNINVNKIFKFIMAKLFNLPWTVERNLTIGEPIIDF